MKRTCPVCHTEFPPNAVNHVYCDQGCKSKAKKAKARRLNRYGGAQIMSLAFNQPWVSR